MKRLLVRRVCFAAGAALALTVAMPLGQPRPPGGSEFPLAWVAEWAKAGLAWAGLDPVGVPAQQRGGAVEGPHEVSTAATRAGNGEGQPKGTGIGLAAEAERKRENGAEFTTRAKTGFVEGQSTLVPESSSPISSLYRNPDGSLTNRVYQTPVNFKGPDGKIRPIDTTLLRGGDGRLRVAAHAIGISFAGAQAATWGAGQAASADSESNPEGEAAARAAGTELVSLTFPGGESFGYQLQGARIGRALVAGPKVTYPNVLPHTDAELVATRSGIKDTLILKRPGGPNSWVFPLRLNGLTVRTEPDGSIALVDAKGKALARIPRGIMRDSKVQPDGEFAYSQAITYELITVNGAPAMKVTADAAWLNDPVRVYPVRMDPPAQLWDDTGDAYVTKYDTRWGENSLGIGCFDADGGSSSGCDQRRAFLSFANFGSYAYGPPGNSLIGKRITGATLHIFHTWSHDCPSTREIHAHRVTQPWSRWDSSIGMPNGKWPGAAIGATPIGTVYISTNYDACLNSSGDRTVGRPWTIPITDLSIFNDWSRNPSTNYGIALTTDNDLDYKGWKRIVSRDYDPSYGTNAPYIDFQWEENVPPQIEKRYPPNLYASPTLTPELIAQAKDPDNFPTGALKYTFKVMQGTNVVAESPADIAESTWRVPEGKLKWGEAYSWVVDVFDGYSWAPSPWQFFTTPVPQPPITSSLSQNGGKGFAPTTGNYTTSATDAEVPTVGPPLDIQRYYNSRDPRTDSVFGAGWSSLLDAKAVERSGQVIVTYPTGESVAFGRNADGTYASPLGKYATFKQVTGGYELVDKSGTTYAFTDAGPPGDYGITSITDAQGRRLSFGYVAGKVTSLASASGRKLFVEWTADGKRVERIKSEELNAGVPDSASIWTYSYVADKLDKVCPPTSITACTRYEYGSNTLHPTAVMDARPQTYLRLNEASGSVASSAVVSLDTATGIYQNVTLNQPGRPGSANVGAFNGSSSVVELSAKKLPLSASYQSVSLWFKTTSAGVLYSYQSMPMGGAGNQWNPALYVDNNGRLRGKFWNGGTTPLIITTKDVRDDAWHHAVLTAAGTTQSLYLDGGAPVTMTGAIAPNGTAYAYLGGGKWESWDQTTGVFSYFNGSMSDFAWFDQPLSESQIQQMYAQGNTASSVLTKVKRPSGNVQATITYQTDASVKDVTDANGGVWRLTPPAITASDHTYAAVVQSHLPTDYYRMRETGVSVPFNEVNSDDTSGLYSSVTLGVDGGPFGDDIDVASFNGTSSAVKLPSRAYPNGGAASSVSMWFRTTGSGVLYGAQGHPLGELAAGGWQPGLYVGVDGKLYGGYWAGGQSVTAHQVNDGAWHHVAMTASGTKQVLWLDGVEIGTKNASLAPETFTNVYPHVGAGRWKDWTGTTGEYGYFSGQIAEFAYFRSELTAQQVRAQAASRDSDRSAGAPGYVAAANAPAPLDYFRLAETTGTSAVNQVAGGPAATYSGVTLGEEGPFGTAAAAATFSGSHVALPSRNYANGQTPSTVSLWFKTTKPGGVLYTAQAQPLNTGGSYAHQPGLYVDTAGKLRGGYWPANQLVSGKNVDDGMWHHAVLASSGTEHTLYLDGLPVGTRAGSPEVFSPVYTYLGNGTWEGWNSVDGVHGQFFGQIAEFAYYSSRLTQDQVTAQFVARDRAKSALVKVAVVKDPINAETKYLHDLYSGRQTAVVDPAGGRTAFGYDTAGFLYSVTDPNGNVVITEHDSRGNTVAETTCVDQAATDPCSTVYTGYYGDGVRADLVSYIGDGRSTNKDDLTYRNVYYRDDKGNVTAIFDPLGRSQNFNYTDGTTLLTDHQGLSGYGRYVRVRNTLRANPSYGYSIWDLEVYGGNGMDDLARGKNATASSFQDGFFFPASAAVDGDPQTRWSSAFSADPEWVQVDLNGSYPVNRVSIAWESSYAKSYEIQISEDGTNWVTMKSVVDKTEIPVPAGLVRKETTPGGAITRRVYSAAGDVVRTITPEGLRTEYKYDTLGRVLEKKEFSDRYPSGLTTQMTYDRLGRLETQRDPGVTDRVAGGAHVKLTQVEYNHDGQVKQATVSDAQSGSTEVPRTTIFGYNDFGQKVSQADPEGNVTSFEYNLLGRMIKQTQPDLTVIHAEYNHHGKVTKTKSGTQTVESRAYDPGGRLAEITDAMGWKTKYKYTDNNLVASVTRLGPAGAAHVNQTNKYDRAGNLTEQWTNNGKTHTKFEVDGTSRPKRTTVDPNGENRVSTYTYGLDNQLLSTTLSGSTGQQVIDATYDRMGRRISQSVSTQGTNGLVGRWKLDDPTGTTAADSAGNRSMTGNFTPSTERDGSAQFDGVDDMVSSTGPVVDTSQSYSVAVWVKMTSDADFQYVVAGRGVHNEHRAFALYYYKWGNKWSFSSTGSDEWWPTQWYDALSGDQVQLNTWTHLAGVFNDTDGSMRLYVNGVLAGSTTNPSPWRSTGKVSIGASPKATSHFSGGIDDVQIYQRALSDTEVSAIHGGTNPADQAVQRTTWQLDKRGLPIAETEPNGSTTNFDYDEAGGIAVTTSPSVLTEVNGGPPVLAPRMESIAYNTFGEAIEAKDPVGQRVSSERNRNGQVVETWMPSYTAPGAAAPIGDVVNHIEYDTMGRVKATVDPLGNRTTLEYDPFGRLKKRIAPDLGETTYAYDDNGKLLEVIDPLGAKSTATYDYLGRELTTTQVVRQTAQSHTTTYGYHAGGWLASMTPPGRASTTFEYNNLGETTKVIDGKGNATQIAYDFAGRQVLVTAPDLTKQATSYDFAGRPFQMQQLDATNTPLTTATVGYDMNGNVVSATDPMGATNIFEYDATGLLTKQIKPIDATDSIVTSFGYDAAGSRTRFTDGRGTNFITTYNAWGLPEKVIEPGDVTYTTVYDKAGNAVEHRMPGGATQLSTYDSIGRLTLATGSGAEVATADKTFGYDLAGRLTSASGVGTVSYDDRGLPAAAGGATFAYTADGLMGSRTDAAGTTSYEYDEIGRLKQTTNTQAGLQLNYDYDNMSLVDEITYGGTGNKRTIGYDDLQRVETDVLRTSGGGLVGSVAYEWDNNGNMKKKTTSGFAGSAVNDYTYDKANRLLSWNNGSTTVNYAYDKSGNRTLAGSRTFAYDERNQLLSSDSGATTYTYSPRGTLRGVTTGTVTKDTEADAFGQVLRQESATTEDVFSEYTYDALGRALRTGFTYSGLSNDLSADPAASYVRGPGGDVAGVKAGASAGVYAWTDLHTDVVGQFGATSATLTGSRTYDPFGKTVAESGMQGNLGYQSEWTDAPTGRVNMHARWYNTDTGQFDTRDPANVSPVPDSGGANRYAYAGGNPLTRVDPTGNAFMEGCKSIGGCLVQGFVNAFDFVGMVTDLWHALSDIKATINSFANSMKEEAARWRGTIRGMMPCPWWVPNKVCDAAAEIGGWACALSGVCEIIQDCLKGLSDHGSRMQCAEHVGGALADGVQGLVSGGAAAVGKFLAKRLLDKLRLPKKGHDSNNNNDDGVNRSRDLDNDIREEMRLLRKYKQSQGNKNKTTKWKPPGKPKKNNGPKPPPGVKKGGGSKNNTPPPPPKPRTADPRPDRSAPPPAPAMPGLIDLPRSPGGRSDRDGNYDSCQRKHSFDPSTPVLMADGSAKAIKDVKLGEKVAATDPVTGATTAQPVTALHVNLDRELTDVTVRPVNEGDGDRSTRGPTATTMALNTTQNHPFWDVSAGAWVEAKNLKPGKSTLTGPDGQLQHVVAVRNFVGAETMRDLTVATVHTYYVVAGDTPVLVHNCGKGSAGGNDFVDSAGCTNVCLGVGQHSDDLAASIGGHTFNGPRWAGTNTASGRPLWMEGVGGVARNGNVRISFSLDGLFGANGRTIAGSAEEAFSANYARGLPMVGDWRLGAAQGNGTAWELATVGRAVRLGNREWSSIDWYWQGNKVNLANPFG